MGQLPDGLQYFEHYVEPCLQQQLIQTIDSQSWLTDLKRRVQHYGYKYDYRAHRVYPEMYLGPLPEWGQSLAQRFLIDSLITSSVDQMIVNEYLPGQGIASHIDCVPCFDDTILSLSLGSAVEIVFSHVETKESISLYLQPGSLLVMVGDARYKWRHGIPSRKSDSIAGVRIIRGRRLSLTFRRVLDAAKVSSLTVKD